MPVNALRMKRRAVNQAILSWAANIEPDLAGYRLWHGTSPGNHPDVRNVSTNLNYWWHGLSLGVTHYFAVTAIDQAGNESAKSAEVSKTL